MKNIFIIGSCRIQRPLNRSNPYPNLYNCLNTKWGEKIFFGPLI